MIASAKTFLSPQGDDSFANLSYAENSAAKNLLDAIVSILAKE